MGEWNGSIGLVMAQLVKCCVAFRKKVDPVHVERAAAKRAITVFPEGWATFALHDGAFPWAYLRASIVLANTGLR